MVPFLPFLGEGSPAKIDYRKNGTLILSFLLEDLDVVAKGNQIKAEPTLLNSSG